MDPSDKYPLPCYSLGLSKCDPIYQINEPVGILTPLIPPPPPTGERLTIDHFLNQEWIPGHKFNGPLRRAKLHPTYVYASCKDARVAQLEEDVGMKREKPYRFFSPTNPANGLGGPPDIYVCASDSEDGDEENESSLTPETLFKRRVKRESQDYQKDMEERARRASPTHQHEEACRTPNPDTTEFFGRYPATEDAPEDDPEDVPEGQDLGSSSKSPAPEQPGFFKRLFTSNVKEPSLQALEERHREVVASSPDNLVRSEQAKKLPAEQIKEDERKREQREKNMQSKFKKREKKKAERAKQSPDEYEENSENEENETARKARRAEMIARFESAEIVSRDNASTETREEALRRGMDEHEDGWYNHIDIDELARAASPTPPTSSRTRRTLRSFSSLNGLRSLASMDSFRSSTENIFRRDDRQHCLNHTGSVGNLHEVFGGGNRNEIASSSGRNLRDTFGRAGSTTRLRNSASTGNLREVFQEGSRDDRFSHSTSVVDLTKRSG